MAKKRYTPEMMIRKRRGAEILQGQGKTIAQVVEHIGIAWRTCYCWRMKYGGLRVDQARRLIEFEAENTRPKPAPAICLASRHHRKSNLAAPGLAAYNVAMPDLSEFLHQLSIWAIPGIFAITVHEVAHGYVARLFGDRTAEMVGRLTLNPLKHVDPMGTVIVPLIMLLLPGSFIFGWAKPVPVAQRNLRNPRRDMAIVAAAGPASNIVMAVIWALVAKAGISINLEWLTPWLVNVGAVGILFNLVLAVVNLLPVPPLDGGRVVSNLLPARASDWFDRVEPYGFMIVIGLLVLGVLGRIIAPPVYFLREFIITVTGLG